MSLREELEQLRAEQRRLQAEISEYREEADRQRRQRQLEADKLMGDPAEFAEAFLEELKAAQPGPEAAQVFLMHTPMVASVSATDESRNLARKLVLHLANFQSKSGHYLPDSTTEELHELVTAAHIRQWLPPEGLPAGAAEKLVRQLVAHYQAGRHMWVSFDLHQYFSYLGEAEIVLLRQLLEEREQPQLAPLRFHLALHDGDVEAAIIARGGAPETPEEGWDLVLALVDTPMHEETVRWAKHALTLNPDEHTRDVLQEIIKDLSEAAL